MPETGNGFQAGELAEIVRSKQDENGSILIILNTRSAVEKVFEALKQCQPEHTQLYCLTTHLCAKHRADVIAEVKQKLNTLHGQERLICVSSQLIEAGVDVSFDCVIRSMAALPSVAQASGRCNRNAERKCRTEECEIVRDIHPQKMKTFTLGETVSDCDDLYREVIQE